MEIIATDSYFNKLKLLKFKPTMNKIPMVIQKTITDNNLLDISDIDERAKIFLKVLYVHKLKSSTVKKYFNNIKPYLFPNTNIAPNSLCFDNNYPKDIQYRSSDINKIKKFINFIKYDLPNNCVYKWPILISVYSGLRLNEVCNIQMSHLHMLTLEKPIIPLKRKNNKDWEVLYYDEFSKMINVVIENNIEKYKLFTEQLIDSKLFSYTPQALHQKLKHFYLIALKERPPMGFGLHTMRYYLATTIYNETEKIEIAQHLLGHVNQRTTKKYIKQDLRKRDIELQQISNNITLYNNIKQSIDDFNKKN
ncbi:Integrase [Aratus pisonii nudivirus]|nr:Integrase [Aratus pisonii nudivirus]